MRLLKQHMYIVLAIDENLYLEVITLLPKHPYTSRKTSRINSPRMGVRKGFDNYLCPLFSNTRLNDSQDLRTMPTMQFVSVVSKSYIASALAIPCYHLHGGRVGV